MIFETISLHTKGFSTFHNITDAVKNFLTTHKAKNGWVNIFTRHTTATIKINEDESGFHQDLKRILFEKIASPKETYLHDNLEIRDPATLCPISPEECANGHAHVAQMLLGNSSETVPVQNGKMLLGRWQQIFFLELDHARNREIILSFQGEQG